MNSIEKVSEAWKVILDNNHAYQPSHDPEKCECGIELVHRVHVQVSSATTQLGEKK